MSAIESKGPKTKILVVDDELIVAVNIKHILLKYGYEVVGVAGSVDEALEIVKSKSPHLILMDINLKDRVDGITLAKMILEFADVSIIFLTAYSDLTTISRAKEIGSYGYLIKPFESKDLYAAIEMAIYKHSMEKNLQESEKRFKMLFENSPMAVLELDFTQVIKIISELQDSGIGNIAEHLKLNPEIVIKCVDGIGILNINKAGLEFAGVEKITDLPRRNSEFFNEKSIIDFSKILIELAEKKTHMESEFRISIQNDVEKIVHMKVSVEPGFEDSLARMLVSYEDITERKNNELAIIESREKFESIFKLSPDAIAISDLSNGLFLDVNEKFVELSGYTREEIIGNTSQELKFWLETYERNDWYQYLIANGSIENTEIQFRNKSGTVIDTLVSSKIISVAGKTFNVSIIKDITEKKIINKILRESEERWQFALEGSGDGVWDWNIESNEVFYSKKWKEMLGYREDEIENKFIEWESRVHPDDLKTTLEKVNLHLQGIEPLYVSEHRIRMKNGKYKWILDRGKVTARDENANPLRMVGVHSDIDERKLAEQTLAEERNIFVDGNMVVFKWLNAPGWPVKYVSPNFKKQFGWEPEVFLSGKKDFISILHPDDLERITSEVNRFSKSSKNYFTQEYRIQTSQGDFKWIYDFTTIVRDKNNSITHFNGYIYNITERKNSENLIRESEEKYRHLFESMSEGVFYESAAGELLSANDSVLKIFGLSQKEFINRTASSKKWKVVDKDGKKLPVDKYPSRIAIKTGKKVVDTEMGVFNPRLNDFRWMLVSATPQFKTGESKPCQVFITVKDITERKNAEKKIEESEKRYKDIFNLSPNAMLLHQDGRIVMANTSAIQLLKAKSFDQLSKYSALDLVHPDFRQLAVQRIKKMSATMKPVDVVYEKMLCLDGTVIDTEISSTPIIYNGRLAFQVVGRDITASRKMEEMILLQKDLSSSLITVGTIEKAAEVIFEYVDKIEWLDNYAIHMINKNDELELLSAFGVSKSLENILKKFQPAQSKITIRKKGIPIYNNPKNLFGKDVKNSKGKYVKQFAAIPIKDEKKVIGIIVFASSTLSMFTKEQKNLIESIAYQAGSFLSRILAEKALRESEEKYKKFFETDLTADFHTNINGTVFECNPAYVKMFEFHSLKEALNTPIDDLYLNINARVEILNRLRKSKKLELIESVFKTRNGSLINVIQNLVGEFNEEGNLTGTVGYMFDVTKIKIAEKALTESEKRYRELFESMQNGFALHEIILNKRKKPVDYRYITVNPAFEKMTGLKAKNIIGKTVKELLPDIEEYWIKTFGKVAVTGKPTTYENFAEELGRYYRVLAYSPEKLKFAVLIEDITESRVAEAKIKQLSTAVEQSPVSVVITDLMGNIEYVNKRYTEVTGYGINELLGENPKLLKSGYTPKHEYKKLWDTITGGKTWSGIFYNKKKNGDFFWESANISPIRDLNGVITNFIALKEDITEKIKVETELELHRNNLEALVKQRTTELNNANKKLQSEIEKEKEYEIMLKHSLDKEKELNELKSKFISTTSHEFRTPLTSVLSSAELIQRYRKKWSDEKLSYHLAKIKHSIEYLTNLLDDVLTISRSESGKIVFNPILSDVKVLCDEIIEETKSHSHEKHEFLFDYHVKQNQLLIDPKLLRFIIGNLLSNAFKYSPSGGRIKLTVSVTKNNLIIDVSDEGIGIPDYDTQYLFEPFHRAANTMEIPGTGLGLSIVKRSVDLHGGKINIESSEGKGTIVNVQLPIKSEN